MALSYSTGLLNEVAAGTSWAEALANFVVKVFSGTKPANADAAATGTLIHTFTKDGASVTPPVASKASITLTGSSGSIDTIKVGGLAQNLLSAAVPYTSDLTTTAAAVAADINAKRNALDITATSSGAVITLSLPKIVGADGDGLTVAVTSTTLGASVNGGSSSTFGGAGAPSVGTTAVNYLQFKFPAVDGAVSKTTDTWQSTAVAENTGGWFRIEASDDDNQGASTTFKRIDGSMATSGADWNVATTSFKVGDVDTINTFKLTVPSA